MTLLWSLFAAMLAVALLFVVVPLMRSSRKAGGESDYQALQTEVHRRRLAELEADRANGVLDEAQFEQARQELERELLEDVRAAEHDRAVTATGGWGRMAALAAGLLIPVLAVALYSQLGGWRELENGAAAAPHAGMANGEMPPIEEMVAKLEARLEAQPDDLEGWTMMGRSYAFMRRFKDASRAYARAWALSGGKDPQLAADYAEVLARAQGDSLLGEPARLIDKALELDPRHPKALWLAGLVAAQSGDFEGAIARWQELMALLPPESEDARMVARQIELARTDMARRAGGGEQQPAAAPAAIQVRVALAPALQDKAPPEATVFVFARAAQGPRMPLAIVRRQVKDLPLEVTLDDSQAMIPEAALSRFDEVIVGARISLSGDAMPAAGDLEGNSAPLDPHAADPVTITIDRIRK